MNVQKEIKGLEERFDARFTYGSGDFCGCIEGDLYGRWNEAKKDLIAFISRVELDARKDEREKVLKVAIAVVEEMKKKPQFMEEIGMYVENQSKQVYDDISTALKSLSGNNE